MILLGDPRMPEAARRGIWHNFLDTALCCLAPGFARRLHSVASARDTDRAWHLDPWWPNFWLVFARCLTLQTADVEFRHARNRMNRPKSSSPLRSAATFDFSQFHNRQVCIWFPKLCFVSEGVEILAPRRK